MTIQHTKTTSSNYTLFPRSVPALTRAGNGSWTRDIDLDKVALYH